MPTPPTDDTTAQPDTEQSDEDDAAPLAEHIATALTTSQDTDTPQPGPGGEFQTARPRADTDQSGTDTLIAAAQHLTRTDHPTTVAIDTTRLDFRDPDSEHTEDTVAYATLSLVTDNTTLVLAATPLDAIEHEDDALSGVIDGLLAAAEATLPFAVDRVVAGAACQQPAVLDVFDQHDVSYIVRKPCGPTDDDIVRHLAARDETTAATSDTVAPARTVDHDATVLYLPNPQTATTDDTPAARPADQYRAFVTNAEVTPATVTERVSEYLEHWLPVEIQAAALRDHLAEHHDDNCSATDALLAAATAAYNAEQLARHTDLQIDSDTDPSEIGPPAARPSETQPE